MNENDIREALKGDWGLVFFETGRFENLGWKMPVSARHDGFHFDDLKLQHGGVKNIPAEEKLKAWTVEYSHVTPRYTAWAIYSPSERVGLLRIAINEEDWGGDFDGHRSSVVMPLGEFIRYTLETVEAMEMNIETDTKAVRAEAQNRNAMNKAELIKLFEERGKTDFIY